MVEQASQIARLVLQRVASGGTLRAVASPAVVPEEVEVAREVPFPGPLWHLLSRELLKRHRQASEAPVDIDDRWAISTLLVIQRDAIDYSIGHVICSSFLRWRGSGSAVIPQSTRSPVLQHGESSQW